MKFNTTYMIRTDIIYDELSLPHTVFGIDIYRNQVLLKSIPDISSDQDSLRRLVSLCNITSDITHIYDVIDDFLAEYI